MYFFIYGACLLSIIFLPIISMGYGALSAIFHFQNSVRKCVISIISIVVWFMAAGNLIAGNMHFDTIKWSLLVGLSVSILCVLMFMASFWIAQYCVLRKKRKKQKK